MTTPLFTSFLFVQLWVKDLKQPYGGYPGGLQAFGWSLLAILLGITPLTMASTADGTLPTLPPAGGRLTEVVGNPVSSSTIQTLPHPHPHPHDAALLSCRVPRRCRGARSSWYGAPDQQAMQRSGVPSEPGA